MLPYFFVLLILLTLAFFERFYSGLALKPFQIFVAILLIAFAAFRPENIDKDYLSYKESFELFGAPANYFSNYIEMAFFEPFYYLIPSFFKTYISQSHYIFLTFSFFAIIGVSLKIIAINRLTNYFFLSVLCYFCYYFMMHEMTTIRAAVAAALLLLTIPHIYVKNYLKAVLLILLACLFHYSAIFILPLIFLNRDLTNTKFYWVLLLGTFLLAFVDTSFIFSLLQFDLGPLTVKSNNYKDLAERGELIEINRLNIFFLVNLITCALCLFFSKRVSEANIYAGLICKIQIWGLFLFQLLSGIPVLAFRVSDLFLTVSIVSLSYLLDLLPNKWGGFFIAVIFSLGLLFLNLFYLKLLGPYNI